MLVGRVTAVAPPPIPFPCSSTQIVFTERRSSLKIQSKFCVKKEGGEEGLDGWPKSLARWTDSFWRLGEQQKVKLAAENK